MTSKIRILKTNTFETPSIPYGRSSMKKENLYEEKGKTNSTSNEESNEKEERSAFTGRILFIPDLVVEEVSHVIRAAFYS